MADTFTSELPDLQGFMKKLDMCNENVNTAVREGIHKGADIILNEQRRLISSKSRRIAGVITKGKIYTIKKGGISITTGYHASAFKNDSKGFNAGVVGMVFEFGRPGQSSQRSKDTMKQTRNDKEVTVRKGTIQPVPHIRRGFDNTIERAAQTVIDYVNAEIKKLGGE